MPIFGQVWLWSLLAFLVGVLLTWLMLVLPARGRIKQLERSLAEANQSQPASAPASAAPVAERFEHHPLSGYDEWDDPDWQAAGPEPVEQLHGLAAEPPEPPGRPQTTETHSPEPVPEEELAAEPEPVEQGAVEQGAVEQGAVEPDVEPATSESTEDAVPAPAAERPADARDWFAEVATDQAEEPQDASEADTPADPEPSISSRLGGSRLFDSPDQADGKPLDSADPGGDAQEAKPSDPFAGLPRRPGVAPPEDDAEQTMVLPKRQPRRAQSDFDQPQPAQPIQPVQPSMRPMARRESAEDSQRAVSGSLFEPVTPPKRARSDNQQAGAVEAPQVAQAQPAPGAHVAPGPFGEGSAMPLPGGARPSEEFAVKASVTALRYCTADSPEFSRIVAEVWFRSAEDAERVGFRPLA
ncbi:hypothetical protein EV191_105216 [Tamaricihabitans halophyticus]|uniref:Uncharacterized protein n=1 Tax=Tamaricihabitans halophyticus TaxID=1262583 RepID=A0A4R2QT88_9PSEU|nr:hypothetical protein [Tamaricihabitans halophyticus]TCP53153.1 hypothetical protein EV191_105216 [Tamaricihabitans halophyticus]